MIDMATWVLWVHLLAAAAWLGGAAAVLVAFLPAADRGASPGIAQRAHFLTSRAMEILFLTGILNVVMLTVVEQPSPTLRFHVVVGVKVVLFLIMASFQLWMGIAWKRLSVRYAARKARLGLGAQLLLGAAAALLGLTLRLA